MSDICERCGRDLGELGRYRDFIHGTSDGSWCVTLEELYGEEVAVIIRKQLEEMAEELPQRLSETLSKMLEVA